MQWPTHMVAAGGYVFDRSGNILIVKTNNRGWDCTEGQIKIGENLEEGVLRGIYEGSGVIAYVRCLAGIYSNVGQNLFHYGVTPAPTKVIFDFICDYIDGELITSDESSEAIWVHKDKVLEYITTPESTLRFKNILEYSWHIHYCSYATKPEFKLLTSRYV